MEIIIKFAHSVRDASADFLQATDAYPVF